MSLAAWGGIKANLLFIEELVKKGEWVEVAHEGKIFEDGLKIFFEEQVPGLSSEEQLVIKEEGAAVLNRIAAILNIAKNAKKQVSSEAGKMVKGKRGITAYKNI